MKKRIFLLLLIALTWPQVGLTQTQVLTEDDWQPLTNDLSRGELLRMHMPPELDAVPRDFRFPEDTLETPGPRVFGLDISHHNTSDIPFDKLVSKNIRYVFIKATQGVTLKDPKFAYFWSNIGNLSGQKWVARGAYHFLSSLTDPIEQAESHVAYVNLHGGYLEDDLPPVMDLEWDKSSASGPDRWKNHSPAEIVSRALKYLKRVEQLTGRIPMVYVSRAWWNERGIPASDITKFSRYKMWIPDYSNSTRNNENPKGPGGIIPDLWQFTDRSKISGGPNAKFDGNLYKGTLNQFIDEFYNQ